MRKFNVAFNLPNNIIVDAETEAEALQLVGSKFPSLQDVKILPVDIGFRTETYVCSRCGKSALKSDWGPGRIRCPNCGRLERSAAETQQLEADQHPDPEPIL